MRGERTVAELAQQYELHPTQIVDWKRFLLKRAADVFGAATVPAAPAVDLKELHAKIGQPTLEKDFLHEALSQAGLLSYKLLPPQTAVQHPSAAHAQLRCPACGLSLRRLRGLLQRHGHCVGRRHIRTLMQRMRIAALYCKPRTSARHPQHKVYPYLLRRKTVVHANQVWAMDITYVRMHKDWM